MLAASRSPPLNGYGGELVLEEIFGGFLKTGNPGEEQKDSRRSHHNNLVPGEPRTLVEYSKKVLTNRKSCDHAQIRTFGDSA